MNYITSLKREKLNKTVFIIFCIIFFFQPWPDENLYGRLGVYLFEGIKYVFLICTMIFIIFARNTKMIKITDLSLLSLYAISILFSFLFNTSTLIFRDILELLRPFFIFSIMFILINIDFKEKSNYYFKFLIIFSVIQIIIEVGQLLEIDFFLNTLNNIYRTTKVEIKSIRATGMLGNPNMLAFYLTNGIIASIFYFKKIKYKIILSILFLVGVFLTGSLLFVAISQFALFLAMFLNKSKSGKYIFLKILLIIFITFFVFIILIAPLSNFYPRFERFNVLFSKDDFINSVLEIKNFNLRINHWSKTYNIFKEGGIKAILVGLSPGKAIGLSVLDNDFMFIFFRYGLFGFIIFFLIIFRIIIQFMRNYQNLIAKLGMINIIIFFISAFFYETFSTWRLMPLYLIPFGLLLNYNRKVQGENEQ